MRHIHKTPEAKRKEKSDKAESERTALKTWHEKFIILPKQLINTIDDDKVDYAYCEVVMRRAKEFKWSSATSGNAVKEWEYADKEKMAFDKLKGPAESCDRQEDNPRRVGSGAGIGSRRCRVR